MVRDAGMEVCCGGILGLARPIEQRAEFAVQLQALSPTRCRSTSSTRARHAAGRPAGASTRATRCGPVAAFRLALPRTMPALRGRPRDHPGDLGTRDGLLGGSQRGDRRQLPHTLGRSPTPTWRLLEELSMPVKALSATLS
jgi:biotin synthase